MGVCRWRSPACEVRWKTLDLLSPIIEMTNYPEHQRVRWSHWATVWMSPLESGPLSKPCILHSTAIYIHKYDSVLWEEKCTMHPVHKTLGQLSARVNTRQWVKWESASFYFYSAVTVLKNVVREGSYHIVKSVQTHWISQLESEIRCNAPRKVFNVY